MKTSKQNSPKISSQRQSNNSVALKKQPYWGKFVRHDLPFTCNPVWADSNKLLCPFQCLYCYVQQYANKNTRKPSESILFRPWMPELLDKELTMYKQLPQHLKRVQINEAFEYYIPTIMDKTIDSSGKDLLLRMIEVFEKHWNNGNKWMLHILTKSPHIDRHLDILQRLKHMIQVELTIITLDENKRKSVEKAAPSVEARLKTIQKLSDAGIFVRVMAMPFMGDKATIEENVKDAERLKKKVLSCGAKAFDMKNLNYSTWNKIIKNGALVKSRDRDDCINESLLVKSGNIWRNSDGDGKFVLLDLPKEDWRNKQGQDALEKQPTAIIDYGYAELNDVNWGYIYSSDNVTNPATIS